ncbi:hypothetical protein BSL78_06541 [Apostichopus japonicus]|uniref:DDE Tnp4 domain-containing protein n=1 Tax=Stichopus japonicus TaxID=307972 RepID=A0A2G8L8H6_STIJA|nr:hypothetical protein BSL78_06541 [Apostichopus japonicus]
MNSENKTSRSNKAELKKKGVVETLLKSDTDVRHLTGLPSIATFNALLTLFSSKVPRLQYWGGKKRSSGGASKKTAAGKKSLKKKGPKQKLCPKEEFTMVLLKLKLYLSIYFIPSLFSVSSGLVSQVFNTWVKFLSYELKPLIFWPAKELDVQSMPMSMKPKYSSLRCTIDCTEVFIERPRNLELQALTWSDYKHHNTVKILVAISPNGMISFRSKAWGGRTSDQHITRESGFFNLVDPGDLILADRGFTIREDLLIQGARLEIPPPSKGIEQMTRSDTLKTIANARIHVERAIGRMKTFHILQETLPITLVPLVDDIIVICAAIANMQPH